MRPRAEIAALLAAPPRLGAVRVLAIDGPSGSGKSTLAAALVGELAELGRSVRTVPTDHFATWDDPVSWWPRLVDGVLTPLRAGQPGRYRMMDWTGGTPRPGEWRTVEVPEVLIIEGVSSGRRSVRPLLSESIWWELHGAEARLAAAVARDGAATRPDLVRWQAFERGWFTVDDTRNGLSFRYARMPRQDH